MLSISTLLIFIGAAFILTAAPGPDMLLIASRSLGQGRMAGLATLGGILVGTYCHALAVALGVSQIFLMVPIAYETVRWIGASYLLFLAYKTIRSSNISLAPDTKSLNHSYIRIFTTGLATNILNPKMALFMLSFLPQFIQPEKGFIVVQALILATILNCIGFVVNGIVILAIQNIRQRVPNNQYLHRLWRYIMASVFGTLACRLALSARN